MKQLCQFVSRVLVIALLAGLSLGEISRVLAVDTSRDAYLNGGYYHNTVPDGDFIDINSMSVADIQSFLASKGSYLTNAPASQLGDRANGRSAAQIIYDAAHGAGEASGTLKGIVINSQTGSVSPRSLLVTLQKEQSLVTRSDYNQNALNKAMGYGCPDSGGCDARYNGFTNQVEWAAWQLRYNYEAAGKDVSWWNSNYAGQSAYYRGYSRSHNWSGGDTYIVTYRNQATAALYRYTPHVGYGNYNFWQLMINWFGIPPISLGGGQLIINDTETVVQTTYRSHIRIAGTKTAEVRAYFNDQLASDLGSTNWSSEFDPAIGNNEYTVYYRDSNGVEVARKRITIVRHKVGDTNGDGKVDLLDVSQMSDAWGLNVKDDAWLNLNPDRDSVVDLLDLSLLANSFEG